MKVCSCSQKRMVRRLDRTLYMVRTEIQDHGPCFHELLHFSSLYSRKAKLSAVPSSGRHLNLSGERAGRKNDSSMTI